MIVPTGFISLLDAVKAVATDLDPEAMHAATPVAVVKLEQRGRVRGAQAASVSITDRVRPHPISRLPPPITPLFSRQDAVETVTSRYDRLPPSKRESVDRLVSAVQSMRGADSFASELATSPVTWTELQGRKGIAGEQARKLVWQALADGVLQAQLRDDYGYSHAIPPQPWSGKHAVSAFLSGRLECYLPSISSTSRGRVEISRTAFRAWWAQEMPAKEQLAAASQTVSGANGNARRPREEKQADARMWMKRNVTAPGWKRDVAIRDCAEKTGSGQQAARDAWTELPPHLKGTRGAPKTTTGG